MNDRKRTVFGVLLIAVVIVLALKAFGLVRLLFVDHHHSPGFVVKQVVYLIVLAMVAVWLRRAASDEA